MEFGQPAAFGSNDPLHYIKRGSMDMGGSQRGSSMSGQQNGQRPIAIHDGHVRGVSSIGAGLAAARSPPKAKSTSHVPCKFYPQGTCQAGAACQFSHDLDATTQHAPCKYFSRGSCKFGQNCALMHVLPDGRIVNRPHRNGQGPYGRRGTYNNRAVPLPISPQDTIHGAPDQLAFQSQEFVPGYSQQPPISPLFRSDIHGSGEPSPYGSPPNDYLSGQRSPPRMGLTARDAPLPGSWDSQGISQAARHGPYAASVPGRFGIDSPPESLPRGQIGSAALRDMHDPAYNDTAHLDTVLQGLGTSPRESEPLSFVKRPLHSERFARYRMPISSSLNVRTSHPFVATEASSEAEVSDDDQSDGAGEELLPSSLHDLIPEEKLRRSSRSGLSLDTSDDSNNPWSRRVISNCSTSNHHNGANLSPQSGSPSRYSAFFGTRMPSTTSIGSFKGGDETYSAMPVGSPLRPSNLRTSSTPHTDGHETSETGMSMLASQLRDARLNSNSIATPRQPSSSLLRPPTRQLSHARNEDESDTIFSFDNDGDSNDNNDDFDGGMSALAGSQIMGASQTLGGSVAEPRSSTTLSSGTSHTAGAPVSWSAVAAGVIGGGRTK